jgi:energy-coupling factor transporter ATP-binding protein EcfA2
VGASAALTPPRSAARVIVVGPCGAGKTTLTLSLHALGILIRQIAQEHSFVADLWHRGTPPDVLIFLDASFETCTARKRFKWLERDYLEQQRRLANARSHCHFYLATDSLTPLEVRDRVAAFLRGAGRGPAGNARRSPAPRPRNPVAAGETRYNPPRPDCVRNRHRACDAPPCTDLAEHHSASR